MSRTEPDGGAVTEDAPFDLKSEETYTRREKVVRLVDSLILTPLRILWSDGRSRVGFLILSVYFLMGTVGVMFVEPTELNDGPDFVQPFQTWEYPLGTDSLGQDLFALVIHGTPDMLIMVFSGAVFAVTMATIVGSFAGYKGGLYDRVLMTFSDIMLTVPGLPLIIILAVLFQPDSPVLVGIIVTVNAWAGLARAIRSEVLSIRNESYVEASRVMSLSTPRIVAFDIVPNLMSYVLVSFVNAARVVIFSSVGLYFLGILPVSSRNWGVMLNTAWEENAFLREMALHWVLVPFITIIMLSFGFILIAQGADRLFNPRIRARHAKTVADSSDESAAEQK